MLNSIRDWMLYLAAGLSGDEIISIARSWIFWDWFRMGLTIVAFIAMLKALAVRPKES